MQTQRIRCLTPLGLIAGLLTILLIAGTGLAMGGTMFSPGSLNAHVGPVLGGVSAHSDLGGKCESCHTAPWNPVSMTSRCLECHQQIADEFKQPQSLHAVVVSDPASVNCRTCHTEHQGSDGTLTRMDVGSFQHERTGFSLASHMKASKGNKPLPCQDCHTESLKKMDLATCTECHQKLDAPFMQGHLAAFGIELPELS